MSTLHACHECDLLQQLPVLDAGQKAVCARCGALLARQSRNSIERCLALVLAGLVLFAVATSFPFLALKSGGFEQQTSLMTGIWLLFQQGLGGLAAVVLMTCVLFPFLQMIGLLYVLAPLQFQRPPLPAARTVFFWVGHLQPWGMMEVFMLGLLVSLVKLVKLADIVPGLSVWAFALLIVVMAALLSVLDRPLVWRRLEGS